MFGDFLVYYSKPLVIWVIWLCVGTIFYSHYYNFGWSKGFYMSINVGYSIGWGYPKDNLKGAIFSIFYLLLGASFVAAALGSFARQVIATEKQWYHRMAVDYDHILSEKKIHPIKLWWKLNYDKTYPFILWIFWVLLLVMYTMISIKWDFVAALYHAISSYSTGGLWAIPENSSDRDYVIVGFFTALGVPLMAYSMGDLAQLVMSAGDSSKIIDTVTSPLTTEEIAMMKKFGLIHQDISLDRIEYLLISCIRCELLSNDVLHVINKRFDQLDKNKEGVITIENLMRDTMYRHTENERESERENEREREGPVLVKQLSLQNELKIIRKASIIQSKPARKFQSRKIVESLATLFSSQKAGAPIFGPQTDSPFHKDRADLLLELRQKIESPMTEKSAENV